MAGVPRPVSFIASDSSFSSTVLPAVSMAVSSVASVRRLGGRVFFFKASMSTKSCGWPNARPGGKTCSTESSLLPTLPVFVFFSTEMSSAFQPTCCTTLPDV